MGQALKQLGVDEGYNTEKSKKHSCKQIFKFLSKYKKVRTTKEGKWQTAAMLKYIEEVTVILGV